MTGTKWGLTQIDSSEGVIHVEEQMEATLEVFQDCDKSPGPIKLCQFHLKGPAPKTAEETPWGLAWLDEEAHLCGPVHIKFDPAAKVVEYKREQPPDLLVRRTGGKDHELDKPRPERLRGGYVFAPAELADPDILGPAGVKKDRMVASVDLILSPANKQHHRLYLFHPAPARQLWMYDEHTFKLSYVLTSGDKTWRADGPTIKVPAYEFPRDSGNSNTLQEKLKEEYGDTSKKPPLHARDYVGLLTGLSPISIALRGFLPLVVDWINGKIPAGSKYTLNAAELVCTFLSEGAVQTLKDAIAGKMSPEKLLLSGYEDLGIDSFISAYEADQGPIRVLTFDQLREMIAVGRGVAHIVNEKDDAFKTFDRLPLPLALYAVAALYTQAKHFFARDLEDPAVMGKWAMPADQLPLHVQFFWATLYYNTGLANGKGTLGRRGVEYHDLEWPFEDDHAKYARYEKYNANWRTASFRVLQLSLGLPGLPGMGLPGVDLSDLPSPF
ncbi:MAG: hypothetical protein JNL82_02945 [Myxococcales bacterium]|nr:hypothetical protein [Myxococcales bacterium]